MTAPPAISKELPEIRRQEVARRLSQKAFEAPGDMYIAMADYMIEQLDEVYNIGRSLAITEAAEECQDAKEGLGGEWDEACEHCRKAVAELAGA